MDNNKRYIICAQKLMAEFDRREIRTSIYKEITEDGQAYCGVRIIEDPHFGPVLTLWFNVEEVSNASPEEIIKFVDEALKKTSEMESPLKKAHFVMTVNGYEKIKKNILPFFLNKKQYAGFLKTVPNRDYLDFAVTYCNLDKKTGKNVTITNEVAEKLGVTEEQLYEDAIKNLDPQGPIYALYLCPESESDTPEIIAEKEKNDPAPLYFLSNSDFLGGASVILDPDFLETVSKRLGGDYYVFLGGDMFVTAIPMRKKKLGIDEMKEMVKEVYKNFKNTDSIISEEVYYYRSLSRMLASL